MNWMKMNAREILIRAWQGCLIYMTLVFIFAAYYNLLLGRVAYAAIDLGAGWFAVYCTRRAKEICGE